MRAGDDSGERGGFASTRKHGRIFTGKVVNSSQPSGGPPTLQTIADATGLSRMAVSLALRNRPGVTEATRERVRATAEALGYRPNPLVSAFQAQVRARRPARYQANLAWINDHPEADAWRVHPWLRGYLDGARAHAASLGFVLEPFHHPPASAATARGDAARLRVLQHRGIQGVILPWLHEPGTARLDWSGFSVAMIGENVGYSGRQLVPAEQPLFHHANPDTYYNLHLAWTRLRERGARRIGLAVDHLNDALVESQQQARLHVIQQSLPQDERVPPLLLADANSESSRASFARWLDRHQIDAVMLYNESLMNGLTEVRRRGLLVAQLNYSDASVADLGVDNCHDLIAAAAVDQVVSSLLRNERGRAPAPRKVLVRGVWRQRA